MAETKTSKDRRKELYDALDRYRDHFESVYPTFGMGIHDDTVEIINRCIREDKTVYELGLLPDPMSVPDVHY